MWPSARADARRSGLSTHGDAPIDLSQGPSWKYELPRLPPGDFLAWQSIEHTFNSSAAVDADGKIFLTDSRGTMRCFDGESGKVKWRYSHGRWDSSGAPKPGEVGVYPCSPLYHRGAVYAGDFDGRVVSLDAEKGAIRWRVKVGESCPLDPWCPAAAGPDSQYVLVAVSQPATRAAEVSLPDRPYGVPFIDGFFASNPRTGAQELLALRASDGGVAWRYAIATASRRVIAYNCTPCVVEGEGGAGGGGGRVLLMDIHGGVICLNGDDGIELWYAPGPTRESFTTGGVCVGPVGSAAASSAFAAFNCEGCGVEDSEGDTHYFATPSVKNDEEVPSKYALPRSRGMVRALSVEGGDVLWSRSFDVGISQACAVGPCAGVSGVDGVVACLGNNPGLPDTAREVRERKAGTISTPSLGGEIVVLNAADGATLWAWSSPVLPRRGPSGHSVADPSQPDHWGSPTVGKDGTVYVVWSGGWAYALRGDAATAKAEVLSSFEHGFAVTASAPLVPRRGESGGDERSGGSPCQLLITTSKSVLCFSGGGRAPEAEEEDDDDALAALGF